MMMMGLEFMGEVPFRDVYFNALVRDQHGAKMSKSKGNVIDPLTLIDKFGADALRFTLAVMATQGRDVKMSVQRVEGYRNFATKLWNAARFAALNGCAPQAGFDPHSVAGTLNKWALGELARATREVTAGIEAYRFNEAAGAAYRFIWNLVCDWYLELAKPVLLIAKTLEDYGKHNEATGEDEVDSADYWEGALSGLDAQSQAGEIQLMKAIAQSIRSDGSIQPTIVEYRETRATIAFVLDGAMKLLHPFMPFITEELWGNLGFATNPQAAKKGELVGAGIDNTTLPGDGADRLARDDMLLALAPWPKLEGLDNLEPETEIGWLIDLVTEIRSVRAEMNVPAAAQLSLLLIAPKRETRERLRRWDAALKRLARLASVEAATEAPPQSAQLLVRGEVAALPLAGIIDIEAEHARLSKERDRIAADMAKIDAKLANGDFVKRAPEEVVEEQRERKEAAQARLTKLGEALTRLN
jgi:valyl-tRNA synthetase